MEKNVKPKAVIYCRVSTKEQVEEGNSLATQERNCREYAKKYDYDVAEVFVEEGESAKTAERTELQKLLRFCADKKQNIKAVIIYKIDRLSRNTDDYSQLRILLKRYGVEIRSSSEYFENTPAGRFMENIIANVAQFDNDVRTERSVGGMKEAVRGGRYVWMAPIGYSNHHKIDGRANIVPSDQAALVREAFEMMAERQYAISEIYSTMYSKGLKIVKSQFYKMLKNEIYAGWICKFGERHKGTFEPIVSQELFNRVQQVMRIKITPLTYKNEHPDFPLRRFVFSTQNYKLTGAWSKGRYKKYAYYRFVQTKQQWPKEEIENAFMAFMDKYAFDDKSILRLKDLFIHHFDSRSEGKKKGLDVLMSKRKQLKDKQSILINKNIKGVISDSILQDHLALLDEEIWQIDKALAPTFIKKRVDLNEIFQFLETYLKTPSKIWGQMPLYIKLKLQWFQFPKGVVLKNSEFRTTEISSIFKLKEVFLAINYPNVHYPITNYKHNKSANFPPLKSVSWDKIEEELTVLHELYKAKIGH